MSCISCEAKYRCPDAFRPHAIGCNNYNKNETDNYDIDSIALRFNVDYPKIIQTQTITKTVTKKKHWNYGVQTGIGYGIYNRKPDLYIGVGVQYNM